MELRKGIVEKDEEDECQVVVVREMQKLSSDAVYEILTRVKLDSLLRQCQWVCKDWQELIIRDSKFQQKHSQKTPSIASGYFVQFHRRLLSHSTSFIPNTAAHHSEHKSSQITSPSLDFLPESPTVNIESASYYGSLLCCTIKSSTIRIPTYYICKPATREWKKMPNPRTRLTTHHAGIVVTQSYPKLQFKILRLSKPKTGNEHHCEVFDSTSWAWKRLEYIKFNRKGTMLLQRHGVFVNGGFHWLTKFGDIFVYYVDQEKWTTIDISSEMKSYAELALSTAICCDGKVGILYNAREWTEIWILESYSAAIKPIWKRKFRIDTRGIFQNTLRPRPIGMWSNDTVMMVCDNKAMWFNCNDGTYTISEFSNLGAYEFYPFRAEFCYF